MAYIKLICTNAILLTLTARDIILFTEGRPLKARGEVEHTSMLDHSHVYDDMASQTNHGPIVDHSVAGYKQTPKTRTFDLSLGFEDPIAVDEDDFRPTIPGNSPGVGHSYPEQMGNAQTNKKIEGTGVNHSMEGNADDFRPTTPGHSPGVGHSIHNTNVEQNP